MSKKKVLVAEADKVTKDGKVFGEGHLKLHAKESPDKYFYDSSQKSLFEERRKKQRK